MDQKAAPGKFDDVDRHNRGRVGRGFRALPLAAVVLWGVLAGWQGTAAANDQDREAPEVLRRTVLSEVYHVDRIYRSMTGPSSGQVVKLLDSDPPELLWIVGYEAVMVGPDGETPQPQEYMCHSNLDLNASDHRRRLKTTSTFNPRLFTLSQGQLHIRFPDGFGIPVLSDESLSLITQVLNLNVEGEAQDVRHKVTIELVRDAETDGTMKALFPTSAYGLALLEGDAGYYGIKEPDEEAQGPGCLPGDNASTHEYKDGYGRRFTGHWVVEPGRQVNRTLVTRLMNVPYDTTIHYIAVHLHPFAESLELRDLTTGETLFHSQARNYDDRIGLSAVDSMSSPEGLPVFADHEYELVSTYNNTTTEKQDSMAVMYLYLYDRDLDRDKVLASLAASDANGS